jgi:DNA repair protein RecO (recombination protein O)
MEWRDEGIVLGVMRHGEGSVVLEVMTRRHGRHLGLVRGGRSLRMQPLLQPGNEVTVTWRGRLEEHLGHFAVDAGELHAARLMENAASLFGLTYAAALLRLLAEREVHEGLFEALGIIIAHLNTPLIAGPLIVRLEAQLLTDLGFGLDLATCAVTGSADMLTHVSPRTGRAVSAEAARPYHNRLMPLPAFMINAGVTRISATELDQGFTLTGHFLRRHVLEPRGLAEMAERASFIAALQREAVSAYQASGKY